MQIILNGLNGACVTSVVEKVKKYGIENVILRLLVVVGKIVQKLEIRLKQKCAKDYQLVPVGLTCSTAYKIQTNVELFVNVFLFSFLCLLKLMVIGVSLESGARVQFLVDMVV